MSDFVYTTAIKKLRKLTKRIRIVPGGTSGGKTYGIIPILIDNAARNIGEEISIVAESIPHLRRGAMRDFLKIMKATNRYIDANWNRTLLTYTFTNGSYMEFFSADDESKVRGARRKTLYINECNNISFDTYHQLAIRTSGIIWLDYNPTQQFWANTELANDEDADWLTLTYKDNEALNSSIVKEIEKALPKGFVNPALTDTELFAESNIKSSYWANWWKVYGLGLTGMLEGVILNNWKIINSVPDDARKIGSGLDFGYTNDPTALTDIYKYNNNRVLDERIYSTGLTNPEIAKAIDKSVITYADSAEPKSIDEINIVLGKTCLRATKKGADSIQYGLQLMQQQTYLVTKRSVNIIKELRSYCWDSDKNGVLLNKPIDKYNHAIDGIRYHEMMTLSVKQFKFCT